MATAEKTEADVTRSVLEQFYGAVVKLDEAALRELVHEDAELHQPPNLPYGGIYRGVSAMLELWKNVIIPLADVQTAFVDSMVIEGGHAVAIAGADMAGSGKPSLACEDYLVRDGKIARIRMFWFDPTPVIEEAIANGVGAG